MYILHSVFQESNIGENPKQYFAPFYQERLMDILARVNIHTKYIQWYLSWMASQGMEVIRLPYLLEWNYLCIPPKLDAFR